MNSFTPAMKLFTNAVKRLPDVEKAAFIRGCRQGTFEESIPVIAVVIRTGTNDTKGVESKVAALFSHLAIHADCHLRGNEVNIKAVRTDIEFQEAKDRLKTSAGFTRLPKRSFKNGFPNGDVLVAAV